MWYQEAIIVPGQDDMVFAAQRPGVCQRVQWAAAMLLLQLMLFSAHVLAQILDVVPGGDHRAGAR